MKQQYPSASVSEVHNETLATIRSLADDGLILLGAMSGEGGRWEAWEGPIEKSIQKISSVYMTQCDDPPAWVFSGWLKLTDKGQRLAQGLEEDARDPLT